MSAWIGLAELALSGCTTTSDHVFLHPNPRLVDGEIAAAREVGVRLHAGRGAMDMRHATGGYREPSLYEDTEDVLIDFERLVKTLPRSVTGGEHPGRACSLFAA